MKFKNRIQFQLLAMACLFTACGQRPAGSTKEQVLSVTYNNAGGGMGWNENLMLTPDSVFYSTLTAAKNNLQTKFTGKNTKQQWNEIAGPIDAAAMKSVISGASRQPVDGTDQTYTIVTDRGKLTFMNPDFKARPDDAVEKWVRTIQELAAACQAKSR